MRLSGTVIEIVGLEDIEVVILSYFGGLSLIIPWGKAPVTEDTRLTQLFHNLRDRCALILNVRLDARHDDE